MPRPRLAETAERPEGVRSAQAPTRDEREAHAARAGAYIAFWFELPTRPTTDLLERAHRELTAALKG